MLVLTGEVHDLRHFGFCDLVGEHTAKPDTAAVDMQHDLRRLLAILAKEAFENVNDKLHWSVVVIQHIDFVHRWLFGLNADLRHRAGIYAIVIELLVFGHVTGLNPGPSGSGAERRPI
jgi:hypothetical protein